MQPMSCRPIIDFVVLAHCRGVSPAPDRVLFKFHIEFSFEFRPIWASIFYESRSGLHPPGQPSAVQFRSTRICLWPEKRHKKKGHPTVLACVCSVRFSLERALWTHSAQTVLAHFRSKLPVLDNTKGVEART